MLDVTEGDDDKSDEEEEGDEDKVDKQMGDLGDEQADRLDEQVWGSDEEEDQDQPKVGQPGTFSGLIRHLYSPSLHIVLRIC